MTKAPRDRGSVSKDDVGGAVDPGENAAFPSFLLVLPSFCRFTFLPFLSVLFFMEMEQAYTRSPASRFFASDPPSPYAEL